MIIISVESSDIFEETVMHFIFEDTLMDSKSKRTATLFSSPKQPKLFKRLIFRQQKLCHSTNLHIIVLKLKALALFLLFLHFTCGKWQLR